MVETTKSEKELQDEGWELASTSGGEHLKRTVEMYSELGFEVYTKEVDMDTCKQCMECFKSGSENAYRIYTRHKVIGENS